ncbi:MAG: peptide-methionine (S)-S-oxide reductase MsrA [Candidatus Micrarchaeota archaeon]|nr:peptide-methionine (S)-S-oxide reductase MsrA [Candidatus Micrarchaeota archaeon]
MASEKLELATFGAGCFWGVEELFRQIKGVKETVVGYTGGTTKNPTYENVCSGITEHIEAIQMKFDPKETTYEKLLEIFWMAHNPLQADGQGNDVGVQYHAVIFYHNDKQKKTAEKSKEKLNNEKYNGRIATIIQSAKEFYPAEEYHQKYLQKRGGIGYCHINVKQILSNLKQ